jgi:hypothetical protein
MTQRYIQIVDNIVVNAILADADFITSGAVGDPTTWMQSEEGGPSDEYIAPYFKGPAPYPSWVWFEGIWNPPSLKPEDGQNWVWDEPSKAWFLLTK